VALSEDQIQELIIASIGDVMADTGDTPTVEGTGVLATLVPLLWEQYEAKDTVAPGLRELYVRRDSLRRVMAVLAQKRFDVADNLSGLSIRGSQIYQHYQAMYDCAQKEIAAAEKAANRGGVAIGRMTEVFCYPPNVASDDPTEAEKWTP